ncbi:MAG: tetratricopeptide repeat protein [Rhodothermales bacterium]
MTDLARNRRLFALLDEVAEMTPTERMQHLDVHCADDADLRQEVERLMQTENVHQTEDLAAVSPAAAGQVPGNEVGPFVLLNKLGEGGMGTVYLARHNRLDTKVAVKFIKHGRFATALEKQRFEIEQKSLSNLSHPNIVQIFDAGLLPDGQPYYAMEYIDGIPLDKYCDNAQLSLSARIELFIQVARAIQHAHYKLVVHRDLKPNNVLIQQDGTVKLLDFGIAKLLEESDAPVTSDDGRIMTLEYAAPEQINGDDITVSTDIYGLGIVLYEILTGKRPFGHQDTTKNNLMQAILEETPLRPSTAVSADMPSATSTKSPTDKTNAATTIKLKKQLEGDLDTIILKALQKEPARRYGSVQAFADDLERYLNGLPVKARPDSVTYRVGKFVRRHRAGVLSTLALMTLLITTAIFYVVNIAQARNDAEAALQRAERVTEFTISLFQPADPNVAQGDTLTAVEILDKGSKSVRSELQEEPEVLAEMLTVIGEIYGGLGQYDKAVSLLDESVDVRRTWAEEVPGDLSSSLKQLGGVHILRNDAELAKVNLEEALRYATIAHGPYHEETSTLLDMLGHVAFLQANYDDAENYFRQSIDHFDNIRQVSDQDVLNEGLASALNNLGIILFYVRGNLEEADVQLQRAFSLYQELHSDSLHTNMIYINNSLGEINRKKENFETAVPHYKEGLRISRVLLGTHPLTATMASNLSVAMMQISCTPEIRTYLEEALNIRQQVLAENHASMGLTFHNLAGYAMSCEKNPAEAILLYEKGLEIINNSTQVADLRRAVAYYQLGEANRQVGDYEQAIHYGHKSLSIRKEKLQDPNTDLGRSYTSMGLTYDQWMKSDSADVYLQRGLKQFEDAGATDASSYKTGLNALTRKWAGEGRCDAARPLLETYLQLVTSEQPVDKEAQATILARQNQCKAN